MHTSLETLDCTPEELDVFRDAIRKMAYARWREAGCPQHSDVDYWLEAEREWIGRYYVPHRLDSEAPRRPK